MGHQDYFLHHVLSAAARDYAHTASLSVRMAGLWARAMGSRALAEEFEAAGQLLGDGAKTYEKPAWDISTTNIGGKAVCVTEEVVLEKPFMDLLHMRCDTQAPRPKTLLIAPMSGHFATLLRDTVETLLPKTDIYVTDWKNARDVSLRHGRFGFDDYVSYIPEALHTIGRDAHVIAVCQPTVPAVAATSLMAQADDPFQPLSLTLIAGPIDTRCAPTEVTKLAENKDISFFKGMTSITPYGFKGAGRPVYPGHMQLTAFLAMNPDRHIQSRFDLFNHLRQGDGESAKKIRKFYDEYLAVMDMTSEFYLETMVKVFQQHQLAKGEMIVSGQRVNPGAITRTRLLTIEGGKDDICGVGQTSAALDLCSGLPDAMKKSLVNPDVGHYGTFSGSRFRSEIAPQIVSHIHKAGVDNGLKYSEIPDDTRPMPSNSSPNPGTGPA